VGHPKASQRSPIERGRVGSRPRPHMFVFCVKNNHTRQQNDIIDVHITLVEKGREVLGLIVVIKLSCLFGSTRMWGLRPPRTQALSIGTVCGASE
jgi:hypothetical protein